MRHKAWKINCKCPPVAIIAWNANVLNYNDTAFYPPVWVKKKKKRLGCWWGQEKLETTHIADGNVQ